MVLFGWVAVCLVGIGVLLVIADALMTHGGEREMDRRNKRVAEHEERKQKTEKELAERQLQYDVKGLEFTVLELRDRIEKLETKNEGGKKK